MPDLFRFYGTKLTSTNTVTIVSGVTGTRIINGVNLANNSTSSTASVSVVAYQGTNAFTVVPAATIGTAASSQVLPSPISLVTADDLRARSSVGDIIDVVVSVLERTA